MNIKPSDQYSLNLVTAMESLAIDDLINARLGLKLAEEKLAVAQLRRQYMRQMINAKSMM